MICTNVTPHQCQYSNLRVDYTDNYYTHYTNTHRYIYTLTRPCMATSPSKSILPLFNMMERRTKEKAEGRQAAVGSKVQNMGDEMVCEKRNSV